MACSESIGVDAKNVRNIGLPASIKSMTELFGRDKSVIFRCIKNILKDKELVELIMVQNLLKFKLLNKGLTS